MSFAPVVLFVYNRADHFEKTFDALSKCAEAKDTILYIFSDGPKNEKAVAQVEEVRSELKKNTINTKFKEIIVTESKENKGLAKSIISGVSSVLEKHGKAIILEDDCVVADSFLRFMNRCIDFYDNDKTIGSISGYSPDIKFPEYYNKDVYTAYRSCSMGWATWKDRWDKVDWDSKVINFFFDKPSLIKKLNSNGSDRFIRLYRQTKGNSTSWSVRFGASLVRNDLLTVYPRYSYIMNIGCDETGVHSTSEDSDRIKVDISKAIKDPIIEKVAPDEKIQKALKRFYSAGYLSELKRFLYTGAIVAKNKI